MWGADYPHTEGTFPKSRQQIAKDFVGVPDDEVYQMVVGNAAQLFGDTVLNRRRTRMIEPYNAVGLVPTFWGIRTRADMQKNIEHIHSLTKAAFWLSNLDIPVRLLAIPEGALQGFNDEVLDVDHTEFAQTCAIDIPGPETDQLGELAREYGVFIMAQAKARHEDWPKLFFNCRLYPRPGRSAHSQTL